MPYYFIPKDLVDGVCCGKCPPPTSICDCCAGYSSALQQYNDYVFSPVCGPIAACDADYTASFTSYTVADCVTQNCPRTVDSTAFSDYVVADCVTQNCPRTVDSTAFSDYVVADCASGTSCFDALPVPGTPTGGTTETLNANSRLDLFYSSRSCGGCQVRITVTGPGGSTQVTVAGAGTFNLQLAITRANGACTGSPSPLGVYTATYEVLDGTCSCPSGTAVSFAMGWTVSSC